MSNSSKFVKTSLLHDQGLEAVLFICSLILKGSQFFPQLAGMRKGQGLNLLQGEELPAGALLQLNSVMLFKVISRLSS